MNNTILQGPALEKLKEIDTESIDLLVTDPPYGYSFMNKDWDKAVVGVDTWKECLRVLKPGAFAFIMSSPRQDVLCKMILNLIEAGFETNFTSLYWTYASGFPKAADVSKLVDKRWKGDYISQKIKYFIEKKDVTIDFLASKLNKKDAKKTLWDWLYDGHNPIEKDWEEIKRILNITFEDEQEYEREIIGQTSNKVGCYNELGENTFGTVAKHLDITKPATPQAKQLEGAYAGFQPKPAVEVILVVMKPLSEKTFVDQALSNQKGITWLDDCRIPYQSEDDKDLTNERPRSSNVHPRTWNESLSDDHWFGNQKRPLSSQPTSRR